MKKVLALALAMMLIVASLGVAFAATGDDQSISVTSAVDGEKYNIYKMLDLEVNDPANPTAYLYTIPDSSDPWAAFWTTGAGKDYIDTNTIGSKTYVVWKTGKDTAADMEAFGKAAAAYVEANSVSPTKPEVTAASGSAGWTGLPYGYYLVTSSLGIAASVASTPAASNNEITEKNQGDTTEKKVLEAAERNGTAESWGEENDAAIGDTVTFRSKVVIAKNSTNVVYHDTMTGGLTWTGAANVTVYTDENCTTPLSSANYTVAAGTSPSTDTFTVTFDNDYVAGLTEAFTNLWIKYTAVLNDAAVVGTDETNTPKITWGNSGTYEGTPTKTTTHKFEFEKYDGATNEKLAGAKFKLYTASTGGTALTLAVNADGTVYRVVNDSSELPTGFTLATDNKIVSLASGKITIEGVDSDDYYLDETDPPLGYNSLTDREKVEVSADNNVFTRVANNSGTVLPATGGIGTTIFYVAGLIMVLGAATVLVARRKADAE